MWPPPILPNSDQSYDAWVDDAACGLLDPEWLVPARLPGRPLRNFTNVAASSPRRDPARPAWRSADAESHGAPAAGPPLRPSSGPVAPLETDGVPWSRDAA